MEEETSVAQEQDGWKRKSSSVEQEDDCRPVVVAVMM
jgi:hypothetical protein